MHMPASMITIFVQNPCATGHRQPNHINTCMSSGPLCYLWQPLRNKWTINQIVGAPAPWNLVLPMGRWSSRQRHVRGLTESVLVNAISIDLVRLDGLVSGECLRELGAQSGKASAISSSMRTNTPNHPPIHTHRHTATHTKERWLISSS